MQLLDAVNKRVATPHAVGLPMPVVFIGVTSVQSGSSTLLPFLILRPGRSCVSTGGYSQRFPLLLFSAACYSRLLSPLAVYEHLWYVTRGS